VGHVVGLIGMSFSRSSQRREIRFSKIGLSNQSHVIGLIGKSFSHSSHFSKNRISYKTKSGPCCRIDWYEFFSLKPEKRNPIFQKIGFLIKPKSGPDCRIDR